MNEAFQKMAARCAGETTLTAFRNWAQLGSLESKMPNDRPDWAIATVETRAVRHVTMRSG